MCISSWCRPRRSRRPGKVLVLLAVTLPTLCGLIGLVIDGGLPLSASRQLQHVADSAATAAATEKLQGKTNAEALAVATQFVRDHNQLSSASVTLRCPPTSGPFSGSAQHVEILVEDQQPTYFIHVLGGANLRAIAARSVAGYEDSTAGAAVVVLDPDPPPFSVPPLPTAPLVPPLPAILGGLEVLGLGSATVQGAVHVNTDWGGRDENDLQIGSPTGLLGLSHAVSATPLVGLTKLKPTDIRVVGGVDNPDSYGPLTFAGTPPLKAGRLPVPDPYKNLPVPTTMADSINVKTTVYGGKTVLGLPLIGPPVTLQPGVYDWIEVVSGIANFQPGVYIIRGKNPITQLSLSVVAGKVQAANVMFYVTDTSSYAPSSGAPDSYDGESSPGSSNVTNILPSVVINMGVLGSTFSGLSDPTSPFNGMLIYQRRTDRRPIVLVQENLLGPGQLSGSVYSKWGHVILAGKGSYDARFVTGTMRLVALLDMQIQPATLLPAAQDVYLVE